MDTSILTVFHNPENCEKKIKAFIEFVEHIKTINEEDNFYVCEISEKKLSQFKDIKNLFLIQVKNRLCYRECAINFLLNNIPKYKKIIIANHEIKIKSKNWIKQISESLEKYGMVQAFEKINILNEKKEVEQIECAVKAIKENKKIRHNYFFGGVTGYNIKYLEATNGLFDKCLLDGGEFINTIPFFYKEYIKLNFLKTVCSDTRLELLKYIDTAKKFIKDNNIECNFLNLEAENLLYKKINPKIFNCINKHNFSEIFYENKNKFYELLEEEIEIKYNKQIKTNKNKKPEIKIFDYRKKQNSYTTKKIIWLSDNNTLLFNNIKKVKLYLKKERQLNYFRVIADWTEINPIFSNNECCLEIDKPKNIIILSDFYVPKELLQGNDARKLSAYLYKVEVMINKKYKEYPIEKIIIEK